MFNKDKIKIVSEETAFWTARKEAAERVLTEMKADLKRLPLVIKFQEAIIELCNQKIKK